VDKEVWSSFLKILNIECKIKNAIKKSKSTENVLFTANKALAFFVENDLRIQPVMHLG